MSLYRVLAFSFALIPVLGAIARGADRKPEPLALRMSQYMTSAERDIVVSMRVEPDSRSRELMLEWVADDLSGGSHAITLEGARAAATHQYSIKRMSPGFYTVTAILRLSDGSEIRRSSNLTVVGPGGPDVGGGAATSGSAGGPRPPARR